MAKVLIFNFPGEGHFNPTIVLFEELIKEARKLFTTA